MQMRGGQAGTKMFFDKVSWIGIDGHCTRRVY